MMGVKYKLFRNSSGSRTNPYGIPHKYSFVDKDYCLQRFDGYSCTKSVA